MNISIGCQLESLGQNVGNPKKKKKIKKERKAKVHVTEIYTLRWDFELKGQNQYIRENSWVVPVVREKKKKRSSFRCYRGMREDQKQPIYNELKGCKFKELGDK